MQARTLSINPVCIAIFRTMKNRTPGHFLHGHRWRISALALALLAASPAIAQDDHVREAQHAMMLLGFYSGRADGQLSQKTMDALSRFQRENGLAVTGKADDRTLAALRGKRDGLGGSLSAPPAGKPASSAPQSASPKVSAAPQIPVESRGGGATGIQGMVAVPGRDQAPLPPIASTRPPSSASGQAPVPAAAPQTKVNQVESLGGSVAAPSAASTNQNEGFDWSVLMWGVVGLAGVLFAWLGWLWSGIGSGGRGRNDNPYLKPAPSPETSGRRQEPKF